MMVEESVKQFAIFDYHAKPLFGFNDVSIIPYSAVRLNFGMVWII